VGNAIGTPIAHGATATGVSPRMWDEPGSTCMRLAASAERQLRHLWLVGCRRVGTRAGAHTPGALVQSDDGHALLSPQSAMEASQHGHSTSDIGDYPCGPAKDSRRNTGLGKRNDGRENAWD